MAWPSIASEPSCSQSIRPTLAPEHNQIPWTAARCQRLLRHLSSKIVLLRKEKQSTNSTTELQPAYGANLHTANGKITERTHSQGGRRRVPEASSAADEEWAPNPRPRKKIKRTYSSRSLTSQRLCESSQSSTGEQKSQTHTEISIPNGLFHPERRLSVGAEVVKTSQETEKPYRAASCDLQNVGNNRSSGRYRVTLPFDERLVCGIQKGTVALLRATGEAKSTSGHGMRSLFEICLRKISDYIAEEEIRCEAEDPESEVDVPSTVYSELESLGTSTLAGWEPLRQVVRAHGLSIVGGAFREGLIGVSVARHIVNSCHLLGTCLEAEAMLHCLMESIEPWQKPLKSAGKTRAVVEVLDDYALATDSQGFRYQELAWLLSSGRLPLDWIARQDMIETWNKVIQTITEGTEDAGPAIELFRVVTSMTYGLLEHDAGTLVHGLRLSRRSLRREANEYIVGLGYETHWPETPSTASLGGNRECQDEKALSTVLSLVTVLCAIGLLQSARRVSAPSDFGVTDMTALRAIAMDTHQLLELASDGMISVPSEGMIPLLLAAGLVQATLCRNQHDFAATVPSFFDRLMGLDQNGSGVEEGGSFLCAVAECCARAASEDVFDHTQKMVEHICRIAESLRPMSESYRFCQRVGVAAALEYAQTTQQPKHLHWALNLERAVTGVHVETAGRTPVKTPLRGQTQMRNGYRWEAGICEWVARTPAIFSSRRPDDGLQQAEPRKAFYEEKPVPSRIVANDEAMAPCSPSGRSNAAAPPCMSGWSKRLRRTKSQGECSATNVVFSHIEVRDEDDELFTPESSQEGQRGRRLQEMTNFAARQSKPRGAAGRGRAETHRRRGKDADSTPLELSPDIQERLDVHDVVLDSEDELSYL
ncbi:MAG: hypothetical protein LQ350_002299 [Teloschistes chrysophthalmus]|nr:MAG: hypothetical protein LQ350_002299 [Niorma chrysophthalma]